MTIYLYVKQHSVTGLKYFGKTVTADPTSYNGSGAEWDRHLKEYGKLIETKRVWKFDDVEKASIFAINFSIDNDIVKSRFWANKRIETAKGGGNPNLKTTRKLESRIIASRIEDIRNSNYPEKHSTSELAKKWNISRSAVSIFIKRHYETEAYRAVSQEVFQSRLNDLSVVYPSRGYTTILSQKWGTTPQQVWAFAKENYAPSSRDLS